MAVPLDRGLRAAPQRPAGEPGSFDDLDALISAQAYRLADWHVASDDVNYRRFFDVNTLAALRMERPPRCSTPPTARSCRGCRTAC
ncbi:hypothetical protein HK414_13265 [Ramlibacter terrae]|uniref:Uncharacterized protein n=1 Tax=Ramlibacter terrae TaxID=2732511 RepID=A0ABX6NZF2_9BURK|nr:hypothetical protein HK414_13265 [Ramlibacter terrae]